MVSATGENECPLPSTRTRCAPATSSCTCATDVGRWNRAAPKVTLPAQLWIMSPFCRRPDARPPVIGA